MENRELSHKIIILEILSRSDFPLKPYQISDFFVDNDLTNYFSVDVALEALEDTNNIITEHSGNESYCAITEKGLETLSLFSEKITPYINELICNFFTDNELSMKEENSFLADYYPDNGGFLCHLRRMDGTHIIFEMSLRVPDEAQARAICANWKVCFTEVYDSLMDILVK